MTQDRHAALMDRVYRYQRFFYDASRKYFLLGRDRLLDEMEIQEGHKVLEVGFGTGRNLAILARMHPGATFYGVDASEAMLDTAQKKLSREIDQGRVVLKACLAEETDLDATFGLSEGFDVVFFSYSLSMIPPWRAALQRACEMTREGGSLGVVDFYDQSRLPKWFQRGLRSFLASFHVHYDPELIEALAGCGVEVTGLYGNFAFIAIGASHTSKASLPHSDMSASAGVRTA